MKNSNEVPNKKEKKNGLLGLLNGGASNTGAITPGVIGGSANAAASSGLAALFSAKVLGTVLTVAIVGAAGIVGISNNSNLGGDAPDSEMMMASAQEAANYVPAIQRSEEANEGKSSIAMFNETNKGAVKFDIDPTLNNKNGQNADGAEGIDGADGEGYDADGLTDSGAAEMAEGAMSSAAESAGLNNSNLSTSFGNDKSSKSINMGGNNKPRLKTTFKPMANLKPVTKFKNNSALAYAKGKQAKRVSATRVGSRGGSRALNQAKAMNNMLRNAATMSNFTTARSMTDAAWEGTTGDGESTETLDAGGLSEGEGMTVAPLSNTSPNSTGVGDKGDGWGDIPDVPDSVNVTPWESELTTIKTLFGIAMALVLVAGLCADIKPWGYIACAALCAIAAALCVVACGFAISIMTTYKQEALGGMWLGICGVGMLACIAAAWGGAAAAKGATAGVNGALAGAAKTICLILGAVGGLATGLAGSFEQKTIDNDELEKHCTDKPDDCKAALPYILQDAPINKNMLS